METVTLNSSQRGELLITKRTALGKEWYDIVAVGNKEQEMEVPLVNWKT
jgi:hypothetical protein